jgi:hypothetical protein
MPRRRRVGHTAMLVIIAKGVPGLQAAAVAMLGVARMRETLTTPIAFWRSSSCVQGGGGQVGKGLKERGRRRRAQE